EPMFDIHETLALATSETMATSTSPSSSQNGEMATSQSNVENGFLSSSDRPARRLRRQPALAK
ncbi:MAG: hypothetical protein FWC56_04905, partial [Phycisphaerae bacterium]|nr:hypothetical protein [Phycisphaerae bacterium]